MNYNRPKTSSLNPVRFAFVALSLLLITACEQNRKPEATKSPFSRADFSGNWEMNFGLNDSVEAKLENYFYRMRKAAERQAGGVERRTSAQQGYIGSGSTVIAMARFVEQITRTQVISIEQPHSDIHIDREGTFSLDCQFGEDGLQTYSNLFGEEACGWIRHHLVFRLSLPEGLKIQHRLTLSSDGQQMNIATTMTSDKAPEPFTLNRAYMRFEGLPENYQCEQTVTRGKVCSLATGTR